MRLNGLRVDHKHQIPDELSELLVFNNRCCEEKRRRYYFRAAKDSNQSIYGAMQACTFNNHYTYPNTVEENCYVPSKYYIRESGIHTLYAFIKVLSKDGQYAEVSLAGVTRTLVVGENVIVVEKYFSTDNIGNWTQVEIKCWDQSGSPPTITYRQITISAESYFTGRNSSLSSLPKLYTDSSINTRQHLPHIKIKDFLAWLKDGFGVVAVFNAAAQEMRFVTMQTILKRPATLHLDCFDAETEYAPDILQGVSYQFEAGADDAPEIADLTGLQFLGNFSSEESLPLPPNSGYYAYVYITGKFYVYSWDETTSRHLWIAGGDYLKPYTKDPGEFEVKPAWHPPSHFFEGDIFGTTPMVGCKGSSVHFKVGLNSAPFLLLNYHGMQKSIHDREDPWYFPYASGLRHDVWGTEIAPLEFSWNGEKGLRETFWTSLEAFYANRWMLEGRRQIDAAWFRQLSWEEAYLHKGREYLLDSVEFTVTHLGFTTAKITAWRKP